MSDNNSQAVGKPLSELAAMILLHLAFRSVEDDVMQGLRMLQSSRCAIDGQAGSLESSSMPSRDVASVERKDDTIFRHSLLPYEDLRSKQGKAVLRANVLLTLAVRKGSQLELRQIAEYIGRCCNLPASDEIKKRISQEISLALQDFGKQSPPMTGMKKAKGRAFHYLTPTGWERLAAYVQATVSACDADASTQPEADTAASALAPQDPVGGAGATAA